jgi:hypothetical protein
MRRGKCGARYRRVEPSIYAGLQVALGARVCFEDVVTQHYDVQRTGWNSQETVLTASNVNSTTFGLLHSVAVDDEVDAQPLVLTNQSISGAQGNRTVVYVATEGDTIYAIDASTGTVLLNRNFGTPVSQSVLGNCNNNTIHIGINSTPVIDRAAGMLFVVIYTSDGSIPTYRLQSGGSSSSHSFAIVLLPTAREKPAAFRRTCSMW